MIEDGLIAHASRDRQVRKERSCDFGRMVRKLPEAVALPRSAEEVAGIVRGAAREDCPIAIRGGGHSQGGQSLTDRGLVLDMAGLDRIQVLDRELVRAQAGARWSKVVTCCQGRGVCRGSLRTPAN